MSFTKRRFSIESIQTESSSITERGDFTPVKGQENTSAKSLDGSANQRVTITQLASLWGSRTRLPSVHEYKRLVSQVHGINDWRRFSQFLTVYANNVRPINGEIRARLQKAIKRLIVLLRVTEISRQEAKRADQMSFYLYKDEILKHRTSTYGSGLTFDLSQYSKPQEHQLNNETKFILSLEPSERTEEQLHAALVCLGQVVEAFGEFPLNMQRSLVRVGWYENFEAKRIIIRQGHMAENFYLILCGTAVVTVLETDARSGEPRIRTVACLGRGNSFGEVALMQGTKRGATVTCKDNVELLAVGRSDFVDIFMHVEHEREPEHIAFLRTIDLLKLWPVELLPRDNTKICMQTYFRRGNVICRDINKSDWIYVIKTGSCRVLKKLEKTKPSVPGLAILPYSREVTNMRAWSAQRPGTAQGGHLIRLSPNPRLRHILFREKLLPKRPTTIKLIDNNKVRRTDHERQIDKILSMKIDQKEMLSKSTFTESSGDVNELPADVFVELKNLGPRDTFGIEQVAYCMLEKCASVSLVSDGAEAILINKRFFVQHLNDEKKKKLRTMLQPYPSDNDMQEKLQVETDWEAFKKTTITDHVNYNALLRSMR